MYLYVCLSLSLSVCVCLSLCLPVNLSQCFSSFQALIDLSFSLCYASSQSMFLPFLLSMPPYLSLSLETPELINVSLSHQSHTRNKARKPIRTCAHKTARRRLTLTHRNTHIDSHSFI